MHRPDKFKVFGIEMEDRMKKMKRYFIAPLLLVFLAAFCAQFYAGKWIGILQDDEILLLMMIVLGCSIYSVTVLIRRLLYKKKGKDVPVLSRRGKAIRLAILAALLLAEGVLILVRQGQSWELSVDDADIEYVSLAEMEGEGFAKTVSKRFDNSASFDTSFAVPRQYDLRMAGKNADGLPVTMQVCFYEVAAESLAEPMFEAIMAARMDWNQILMQWELEADVDEAYAAGYMGFQYLFLREGQRIVTVYYYGEQDLNEQTDRFVDMLRQ